MAERFSPPKRGTVFENTRTGVLAVYAGHRRKYRAYPHYRMVTVYRLQAVMASGRAQSYEVRKDGLLKNWVAREDARLVRD